MEKVKQGSGIDLEAIARNPGQFLHGRRRAQATRREPRIGASEDTVPFEADDLYAVALGVPTRSRDLTRSDSLPEGGIKKERPPSPPRSLPPARRVFDLQSTSSYTSSVDESSSDIFGSASDLQQTYFDMSATQTQTVLEDPEERPLGDDTEVIVNLPGGGNDDQESSDTSVTHSGSEGGSQAAAQVVARLSPSEDAQEQCLIALNAYAFRRNLAIRFPMSITQFSSLPPEVQEELLKETGVASKSGLLEKGVFCPNEPPPTSTPAPGYELGRETFDLSRVVGTPRRPAADHTYTRAAHAGVVKFSDAKLSVRAGTRETPRMKELLRDMPDYTWIRTVLSL